MRWRPGALMAALVLALIGCDQTAPSRSLKPNARPAQPQAAAPSEASAALSRHYAALQADLLSRGLLRTDGGGPDTRFTADDLARNFGQIAFDDEAPGGVRTNAGRVGRWQTPVRVSAAFGPTVPREQARTDKPIITSFARRLSRITGHPVMPVSTDPNFLVLVATEDDQAFVADRVRGFVPGLRDDQLTLFTGLPREIYCLVVAFSDPAAPDAYTRAVALIRAEHPDLVRKACIHEEMAQGLGLPNDSPAARPSIFNDDDEFALLTGHDELLLRMLYDDRIRPGMTRDQAIPVARILAREYMGLAI